MRIISIIFVASNLIIKTYENILASSIPMYANIHAYLTRFAFSFH